MSLCKLFLPAICRGTFEQKREVVTRQKKEDVTWQTKPQEK